MDSLHLFISSPSPNGEWKNIFIMKMKLYIFYCKLTSMMYMGENEGELMGKKHSLWVRKLFL